MSLLKEALNARQMFCTTHLYGATSLKNYSLFFSSFSLYGEVCEIWTHLAWPKSPLGSVDFIFSEHLLGP